MKIDVPWRVTQAVRSIVIAAPFLVLWGGLFGFFGWRAMIAPGPEESSSSAVFAALSGTVILLIGLCMLLSRATVRLDLDSTLDVRESIGPFGLRRSFAIDSLTHIAAIRTPKRMGYGWLDVHGAIKLCTNDGKATVVMSNYRRKVVCQTVEKIAGLLGFVPVDLTGVADKTELEFACPHLETAEPIPTAAEVPIAATRKARTAGLCIEAPPSGMTPLLSNLCVFGLLFVVVPVPFVILTWIHMQHMLWFLALPGTLMAAGVWCLLQALVVSRRRAMVEVDSKELVVTLIGGLYGKREYRWPREQVLNVEVVDGFIIVQNQTMKRLHIHARYGARKLMHGRPEHDLLWIAEQLRDELGLVPQADA